MRASKMKKSRTKEKASDDFISVARRLGADEDKKRFEKNLGGLARAKVTERNKRD